ncbi:patatin-like phospholipase family protein [Hathewaya massiliensis]|uniref:patatin-like phospholipase family protein n=1 Tax=Hathewaya massiliensis TaxID=1964382 RepID=UPI001FAAD125|nr:patatin-like phospholipase family protein [Hathewaya massiliensis]
MKIDGVFQGGGVKGIGLVGAICRLEESKVQWKRVAGTSVGAFISSLIAVGYTGVEMEKLMYDLDFTEFKGEDSIKKGKIFGKNLRILMKKGVFGTGDIEEYLKSLYKHKGKTKFKDMYKDGEFKLKVIASDVTNKELLILPNDIKKYGIDPMEFEIAKAVTMSISIPFFFEPVKLNYMGKQCFIVDGGITSNYPIWIFDVKGRPKWPTIGFKFEKPEKKHLFSKFKNNFFFICFRCNRYYYRVL